MRTEMRPRLGVVVTTWTREDGAEYARNLVGVFPQSAPSDQIECIVCPTLLEYESDIPTIQSYFADKSLDTLLLIPGNFTLDHVMPMLTEAVGLPVVLWGLPTEDAWAALVGIQQTLLPFWELGLEYRFFVGELGDERIWGEVLRYARASALVRRMKGRRIGLMGWRAQGMSDVVFDELCLRETFGVHVVNLGMTRYTRAVEAVSKVAVADGWAEVSQAYVADSLPVDIREMGIRSYLAMKRLVEEEDLSAVTLECFHDHLGEPCLGCSIFNDAGIAAPCESDVNAAVVMMAGQILSGEPTFHVDIFRAELPQNTAIMAHCGNLPRQLAAEPETVRLSRAREFGAGFSGPVVQANMRPGPVTVVNLVGRRGTMRMSVMEAEILSDELDFPGSAAQVVFPFDLAKALEMLGNKGYGHHFVLISGRFGDDLVEWCRRLGIDCLHLTPETDFRGGE
jgi:L-fucose isomerase-like protein